MGKAIKRREAFDTTTTLIEIRSDMQEYKICFSLLNDVVVVLSRPSHCTSYDFSFMKRSMSIACQLVVIEKNLN